MLVGDDTCAALRDRRGEHERRGLHGIHLPGEGDHPGDLAGDPIVHRRPRAVPLAQRMRIVLGGVDALRSRVGEYLSHHRRRGRFFIPARTLPDVQRVRAVAETGIGLSPEHHAVGVEHPIYEIGVVDA